MCGLLLCVTYLSKVDLKKKKCPVSYVLKDKAPILKEKKKSLSQSGHCLLLQASEVRQITGSTTA